MLAGVASSAWPSRFSRRMNASASSWQRVLTMPLADSKAQPNIGRSMKWLVAELCQITLPR